MLFELLVGESEACSSSREDIRCRAVIAGDLLIRRPQLLEEITRGGRARSASGRRASICDGSTPSAHYRGITRSGPRLSPDALLRILARYLGLADLSTLFAEHSALAEACLIFVNRLLEAKAILTIIALGKFGGREISYGADLDVLFRRRRCPRGAASDGRDGDNRRAEGTICDRSMRGCVPMAKKDRSSARSPRIETYYETRAQLWEVQALTRARPIAGPLKRIHGTGATRLARGRAAR